jgi:hypothetical protein
MLHGSEVQQRLRIELLTQPLQRFQGVGVGDLRIDLHRDVDLRVPQDAHGDPGMDVQRGEQGGARVSSVVDLDPPNARLPAPLVKAPVEVP